MSGSENRKLSVLRQVWAKFGSPQEDTNKAMEFVLRYTVHAPSDFDGYTASYLTELIVDALLCANNGSDLPDLADTPSTEQALVKMIEFTERTIERERGEIQ